MCPQFKAACGVLGPKHITQLGSSETSIYVDNNMMRWGKDMTLENSDIGIKYIQLSADQTALLPF